jgi:formylglycine-generating enzyme required for sulfatase activity/predicted Ser/Thr protein kinase
MSAPTPPDLPEQFGPYRILRPLAEGAMGTVYLAEDAQGNKVALKVPRDVNDAELLRRFQREARLAALLKHPNLCPVYDVGVIDGTPYLTMAYIEGPTLAEWRQDARPCPQGEAAALIAKLALAMEEAHKVGVIHRDLKPANIKFNQAGEPVILDFGLARKVAFATREAETQLTQEGAILGTPAYMAPEQTQRNTDELGPACDIYALGVILYELLAGRLPFVRQPGENFFAMMVRIALEQPPRPSTWRPGLDPKLEELCLRALAKKPEGRFASMAEMARELTACTHAQEPPPPAPRRRGRRPLLLAAGLLGVCLLGASLAVLLAAGGGGPKTVAQMEALSPEQPPKDLPDAKGPQPPPPRGDGDRPAPPKPRLKGPLGGRPKPAPSLPRDQDLRASGQVVPPRKEFTNSIGMRLAYIPPGTFWMGSPDTETGRDPDEKQHEVEITRPFYLGVFEVTQEEYQKVMGTNPSYFSSTGGGKDKLQEDGISDTRRFSVETVSWDDAGEFCRRLSELREERLAGRSYRLPTEAEWEYAGRGGATLLKATTPFHFGPILTSDLANFDGNAPYGSTTGGPNLQRTTTVGSYQRNGFGLYDMHGNVWEWCQDWYAVYNTNIKQDPQTPAKPPPEAHRVFRGGSWYVSGLNCRLAVRVRGNPGGHLDDLGFRVVCVLGAGTP